MKNRSDMRLLVVFLVGTLVYALLLVLFLLFGGTLPASPTAYVVSRLHLWSVLGGHAIPFFALQLFLCRRSEGGSKFLAIELTVMVFVLLGCFTIAAYTTPGWDALGYMILAVGSTAPAAGCVLAWIVWGIGRLSRKKSPRE